MKQTYVYKKNHIFLTNNLRSIFLTTTLKNAFLTTLNLWKIIFKDILKRKHKKGDIYFLTTLVEIKESRIDVT